MQRAGSHLDQHLARAQRHLLQDHWQFGANDVMADADCETPPWRVEGGHRPPVRRH